MNLINNFMFYSIPHVHVKLLIDNFFSKFEDLRQAFNQAINLSPSCFGLYQEHLWGDKIFDGYRTYKGFEYSSNYNWSFLQIRPQLLALTSFIVDIELLYEKLPGEKQIKFIDCIKERIQTPTKLLSFQLELHTFHYFCLNQGFALINFDLPNEEKKVPDLTIRKENVSFDFDVECKIIDPLKGHPILLKEANNFINLILKEKLFLKFLEPNKIIQISIDKKLSTNSGQNTYNSKDLVEECKKDSTIINILPASDTNIKANALQSHTFKINKSYIKLFSSIQNNYFEGLRETIKKGLDKNFNNPIILVLRPFGLKNSDLIKQEVRDLFNSLFIEKQKEGAYFVMPSLDWKSTNYQGQHQTTLLYSHMTSNFNNNYAHLFSNLEKI